MHRIFQGSNNAIYSKEKLIEILNRKIKKTASKENEDKTINAEEQIHLEKWQLGKRKFP